MGLIVAKQQRCWSNLEKDADHDQHQWSIQLSSPSARPSIGDANYQRAGGRQWWVEVVLNHDQRRSKYQWLISMDLTLGGNQM